MRSAPVLLLLGFACFGQVRPVRVNPTIRKIVSEISAERIAATLKKLESFGTRHAMSAQDDPERGIGAAKR